MKKLLSLLSIIGFVGITVFGFVIFDMGPGHSGGCIASAIDGTTCPTNIVDFATHHISALQTLTGTAVPTSSTWSLLLASLLLISVSIFLFYKNLPSPKLEFLPQRLRDLTLHSLFSRQKVISWLSLFELSPSL